VGHFQTRPESGRISGLKVTQASPQIPRQNLLAKRLLDAKPLIFNVFSEKNGCRSYFNPFTGVVKSGVITKFTSKFSSKSTAMGPSAHTNKSALLRQTVSRIIQTMASIRQTISPTNLSLASVGQ
jgi:hypothetical protein